jgi:hypothetical protein
LAAAAAAAGAGAEFLKWSEATPNSRVVEMANVHPGIDFEKLERIAAADQVELSSDDRWKQIVGLMQFAATVMETSPERERIRAFKEAQEAEWQRIQKRLFANASRV